MSKCLHDDGDGEGDVIDDVGADNNNGVGTVIIPRLHLRQTAELGINSIFFKGRVFSHNYFLFILIEWCCLEFFWVRIH